MKNGLNKFAKEKFAIFTIKLLFFGLLFLNQACQTDDNDFSIPEKEIALNKEEALVNFENLAKQVLPSLQTNLEKVSLLNKTSDTEIVEKNIENILFKLNPLINSSKELLKTYGFSEKDLKEYMEGNNDARLVLVGFAVFSAEKKNMKESINTNTKYIAPNAQEPDVFDCLIRSVGIDTVVDLVKGRISKAAVAKLIKKLAKKALGPIGAAWAIYEFGDCMDWY